MPWTILRTSLVNAMFGGAFFLYFVFGTGYMKAVGFTGNDPEMIGLIAAGFMLVFMIVGSLLADYINRRTILLIAAVVLSDLRDAVFLSRQYRQLPVWRPSPRSSALDSCSASAMARYRPSIPRISRPAIAPRAPARVIRSRKSMAAA